MQQGEAHPLREDLCVEQAPLRPNSVEFGALVGHLVLEVHVVADHKEDVPGGEEGVVADRQVLWEGYPALEAILNHPNDVWYQQDHVLVEVVAEEEGHPPICPPPMAQEQGPEEAELRDGDVARLHGLRALLAADGDTHVRAVDHGHVVRAVAHAECDCPRRLLAHQLHQLQLLHGAQARADTGPGDDAVLVDHPPAIGVLQGKMQRLAIQNQPALLFAHELLMRLLQHLVRLLGIQRFCGEGHVRSRCEEHAGARNVHCGLSLVPCEDPDPNAHLLHGTDCLWHAVLQPVLHGSDATEGEPFLDAGFELCDLLVLAAVEDVLCCLVILLPLLKVCAVHFLRGHDERAQALAREAGEVLLAGGLERLLQQLLHDAISALRDAPDLVVEHCEDGHPLAIRTEGQLVELREALEVLGGPAYKNVGLGAALLPLATLEADANLVGGLDQADLVRRHAAVLEATALGAALLHLDAVADSQAREEVEDVIEKGLVLRLALLEDLARSVEAVALDAEVAEVLAADVAACEDHLVPRQCACLVGEGEVDLAELFHEVSSACQGHLLGVWVHHLLVPVHLEA
mmetsp:Transcript_49161/g.149167  ORF Transcript_49161/g.149167 Transcript_49161/m.149167 type:complete len:574 (-) Transcript_49161:80-1801(-)